MIKVSILIPVYNVEKYILRCLESVISQTYRGGIECIIIDDCGQDNSIRLAENFIAKFKSIIEFRIIHHRHNRGLAAARNTGIENSRGEFVMHLDSDDWLEANAIELLMKKQSETNADIVSGNALAHYDDCIRQLEEPEYANNIEMVYQTIKLTLDHVIWRRLIRKKLYLHNNITAVEGVNIGEDHHTLPKLAFFAENIAKLDAIVYHYNCMNHNSYMHQSKYQFSLGKYESDCRSIQILRDFFEAHNKKIAAKLNLIELEYNKSSINRTLALADHDNYKTLCHLQQLPSHYLLDRLKYVCKVQLRRIKSVLYQR